MAFDVSNLSAYVDENKNELIAGLVAGATSTQVLNLQVGYKSSGAINIMDTDVTFQTDSCGFNSVGDTTFSQRILTVGGVKVQESICPKDLNEVYLQSTLKAGSSDDSVSFEADWTGRKVAKINAATETTIWQGDTGSGDANLSKFDGLIKIIDAATGTTDGNVGSVTSLTVANIEAVIDGVYDSMAVEILNADDAAIMVGHDTFRLYARAVRNKNYFHIESEAGLTEMMVAGTNCKIIAVEGLNGTSRIFAGRLSNFYVGVDLENETEEFELWYSQDDRVVKFSAQFKMGTQIAFPEEIVEFTLA